MDIEDLMDQIAQDAAPKHYLAFCYPFPPDVGPEYCPAPGTVGPFRETAVEALKDCLLGDFDAIASLENGGDWRIVQEPYALC